MTVRAAPGPVQSPDSTKSSWMQMPSLLVDPTLYPAVTKIRVSIRDVVVFPLVPVTSATGIFRIGNQCTASSSGNAVAGHVWAVSPYPTETKSSSHKNGKPVSFALRSSAQLGIRFFLCGGFKRCPNGLEGYDILIG